MNQTDYLEILYHQPGHLKGVNVLKRIDDFVFSGGEDGRICIWNSNLTEELVCLYAHTSPITDIQKLNEKDIVVSCSKDLEIKLWSLNDFNLIGKAKAHSSALIGVEAWQEYLFSAGRDQVLKKWRLENDTLIEENKIKIPDLERFFLVGDCILASQNDGLIVFLDARDFKIVQRAQMYSSQLIKTIKKSSKYLRPFHKRDPYTILYNMTRKYGIPATVIKSEEKRIILGHQFGLVSIWNKSKRKITHLLFVHNKHITGIDIIEDVLLTISLDSSVKTFNLSSNQPLKTKKLGTRPLCLLKLGDDRILVGMETGEIKIINIELNTESKIGNIVAVTSACLSPQYFVLGNTLGEIILLNNNSLNQVLKSKISEKPIIAIFYHNSRIIVISENKKIKFFSRSLELIKTISVEFVPDKPRRVKKYIVLSDNQVLDLENDQIIKGEVSKQTEEELEQYRLLKHEYNRGDVSLFINRKLLEKNIRELSLYYEEEIIQAAKRLTQEYETEGYERKFSSTIFSNNNSH